jgi:hypothetical protein
MASASHAEEQTAVVKPAKVPVHETSASEASPLTDKLRTELMVRCACSMRDAQLRLHHAFHMCLACAVDFVHELPVAKRPVTSKAFVLSFHACEQIEYAELCEVIDKTELQQWINEESAKYVAYVRAGSSTFFTIVTKEGTALLPDHEGEVGVELIDRTSVDLAAVIAAVRAGRAEAEEAKEAREGQAPAKKMKAEDTTK